MDNDMQSKLDGMVIPNTITKSADTIYASIAS
jgi:hypothetical protein